MLWIWRAGIALVLRAKAQLPPRAAVDDGDAMEDVLDRAALLAKPSVVGEEVLRRGMSEEQPERLGADEEVEADLGGALWTQAALGAGAVSVIERGDAVE